MLRMPTKPGILNIFFALRDAMKDYLERIAAARSRP